MRILVVEDDVMLADSLVRGLEQAGHACALARDGEAAHEMIPLGGYDAVVLDLSLPGRDGLEVLRAVRGRGDDVAVVVTSARDRLEQRIAGLDAGADDYLVKAYDLDELLARLRVQVRRREGRARDRLQAGEVVLDLKTGAVTADGVRVVLAAREAKLLSLLMRRAGGFVSKPEIEDALHEDSAEVGSNTVESAVYALRRGLGQGFIVTARGLGYMVRP